MIAVWVWVGALVLAVVVLAFCAYEIVWKVKRLGRDVEDLQQVAGRLTALQDGVARAQGSVSVIARERAGQRYRNGDATFPHPKAPQGPATRGSAS